MASLTARCTIPRGDPPGGPVSTWYTNCRLACVAPAIHRVAGYARTGQMGFGEAAGPSMWSPLPRFHQLSRIPRNHLVCQSAFCGWHLACGALSIVESVGKNPASSTSPVSFLQMLKRSSRSSRLNGGLRPEGGECSARRELAGLRPTSWRVTSSCSPGPRTAPDSLARRSTIPPKRLHGRRGSGRPCEVPQRILVE